MQERIMENTKILLIIEQCNPEWSSVPFQGYCFYEQISRHVNTTLVTHARNKDALERLHPDRDIAYISESSFIKKYYAFVERFSKINGRVIWPIYHTLTYPIYHEFNHLVYHHFNKLVIRGHYNIVHVITPMMPRYPAKIIKACKRTPFVIGPVNGGVPFPDGFKDVAKREFANFNFLRAIGRFIIPGYRETYEKAHHILVGSTYTLKLIKDLFNIENHKVKIFYENGIKESFLHNDKKSDLESKNRTEVHLLFVGRLVPYKGADILIDALYKLEESIQHKVFLTIVGDGGERTALEQQVKRLELQDKVSFTGWVQQQETLKYYRSSDVFCFPSVREFGGAVVIEAMANGLPCIVVDHGGIGEYVTEKTGFKINPISRNFVVQELKKSIEILVSDRALLHHMSLQAVQRSKEFTWSSKAQKILETYQELMQAAA